MPDNTTNDLPNDSELIDTLEVYIRERGYVLLHNLTGSNDPEWPNNYRGGGIGLLPWNPRSLRRALADTVCKTKGAGSR